MSRKRVLILPVEVPKKQINIILPEEEQNDNNVDLGTTEEPIADA